MRSRVTYPGPVISTHQATRSVRGGLFVSLFAIATAVSDAPCTESFSPRTINRCGVSAAGRPGDDPEGGLPPVSADMFLRVAPTMVGATPR